MSSISKNSLNVKTIQLNSLNIPEYNENSLYADEEYESSGLYIVPSQDVLSRPTDITGYVLTASNSDGKVTWSPGGGGPGTISLEDLTDVSLVPESSGQLFVYQTPGNQWSNVTMSGDATFTQNGSFTLAPSGAVAGTYTNSTVTVDIKGRVTSISSGVTVPGALNDLTDVSITSPSDGQFLNFNQGLNDWVNITISGDISIDPSGVATLADTPVTPGSYTLANITVDSKGRVVEASDGVTPTISLNDVTDVTLSGQTTGQILTYNVPSNQWRNVSVSGDLTIDQSGTSTLTTTGVTPGVYSIPQLTIDGKGRVTSAASQALTLNSLTNVNISGITGGNLLVFDQTNNRWQNRNITGDLTFSETGVATLENTSVTPGVYTLGSLTIDQKGRVTAATNGAAGLNNLNDVTLITPSTNQILVNNGTNWVNVGVSGDMTISSTGVVNLSNTAVTPGTYPFSRITVDAKGRVTGATRSTLTNGQILVGNASNVPQGVLVSGDATLANTGSLTLSVTGVTSGTYILPTLTIDAKGRVTSASSYSLPSGQIIVGSATDQPIPVDLSGDATINNLGNLSLSATGVTPGTYNKATITVDAKGRLTAASDGASGGIEVLNGLTAISQTFEVGTSGTNFNIDSTGTIHTFNIPTASATVRGLLSISDWDLFNDKQTSNLVDGQIWIGDGTNKAASVVMSGDASIDNSGVLTLDNSGVVAGVYNFGRITVDAKGRVTLGQQSTLDSGRILVGNASNLAAPVVLSGDATINDTGVLSLSDTTVTPGTYTLANITVDQQGRITDAETNSLGPGQMIVGDDLGVPRAVTITGDVTVSDTGVFSLPVTLGSFTITNISTQLLINEKGIVQGVSSFTTGAGNIIVANDLGNPTFRIMTGDASISSLGLLSLSNILDQDYTDVQFAKISTTRKGRITSISQSDLSEGNILIGDASGVPVGVVVSGDATLASDGELTLIDTGVVAGDYSVLNASVDSKGRITTASAALLDDLSNVSITSLTDGQILSYNATTENWENVTNGGGTPAGDSGEIQFNDNGSFGSSAAFTWTDTGIVTAPQLVFTTSINFKNVNTYLKADTNGFRVTDSYITIGSDDTIINYDFIGCSTIQANNSLVIRNNTTLTSFASLQVNSSGDLLLATHLLSTQEGTCTLKADGILDVSGGVRVQGQSHYLKADSDGFRITDSATAIDSTDTNISSTEITSSLIRSNKLLILDSEDGLYSDFLYKRSGGDTHIELQMYNANYTESSMFSFNDNGRFVASVNGSSFWGAFIQEIDTNGNARFGAVGTNSEKVVFSIRDVDICRFERVNSTSFDFLPNSGNWNSNIGKSNTPWRQLTARIATNVTSDARCKNIITDNNLLELAYGDYDRITKSSLYTLKDEENDKIYMGTIAQDLVEFFEENNLDFRDYGIVEQGEPQDGFDDGKYVVNYQCLTTLQIGIMNKKIKEQDSLIESLERRLSALEAKFM